MFRRSRPVHSSQHIVDGPAEIRGTKMRMDRFAHIERGLRFRSGEKHFEVRQTRRTAETDRLKKFAHPGNPFHSANIVNSTSPQTSATNQNKV
jgi:hypothetical protein